MAGVCSNLRVVTEVARSLVFSQKIQALADRTIVAMTHGGREEFNAVHLRIEKDARDWSTIMGGEAVRFPHPPRALLARAWRCALRA